MLRSYSRGLLDRAQNQYHSCCTRRWFQAIPVIDVEPLVNQQQVCYLLVRSVGSLAKHPQGQPPVQNAAEVGQQLHKACNEVGFFYVSSAVPAYHGFPVVYAPRTLCKAQCFYCTVQVANHGVPTQTCQNVLKEAHAWFALPVTA